MELFKNKIIPRSMVVFNPIVDPESVENSIEIFSTSFERSVGDDVGFSQVKRISVEEHYRQYKYEDFKLSTLIAAGVPLNPVSVDVVNPIDDINKINEHLDRLGMNNDVINAVKKSRSKVASSVPAASADLNSQSN